MGQDNEYVLRTLLAMSEAECAALADAGVLV
jgi:hypothetical protein